MFQKPIYFFSFISLFFSKYCSSFKKTKLASVYNKELYLEDIKHQLKTLNSEVEKQTEIIRLTNQWIEKESLIAEISKLNIAKDLNLEKRIKEYRYSLLIHQYLESEIKKRLDYNISDEEIESYYKSNLKNFELKENIVRCFYIIIPKSTPDLRTLEKYIIKYKKEDNILHLKDFCEKNAIQYSINPLIWHKFETIISSTPVERARDKIKLIKLMKNSHIYKVRGSKDKNIYYFKILDYKISNQTSPLEFVKKQIKNTIIYSRKIKLRKNILEKLIQKQKENKNIKIYNVDYKKLNY